jgi:hypothetical protein
LEFQNGRQWPSKKKWEKCNRKLILDIQNGAGGHFEKKIKLSFDLKWREMQTKINFEHPKWHWQPF